MDEKTRKHIAVIHGILSEEPKTRILFYCLAASEAEVARELIRLEAGIPIFSCKTEYMPEITRAVFKLKKVCLFIAAGPRSWDDIAREAGKSNRPDLIIIDHPERIQTATEEPGTGSERKRHGGADTNSNARSRERGVVPR